MTDNNKTRIKVDPPVDCWINERGHVVLVENGIPSEFIPTNSIMQQFAANMIRSFIDRGR